MASLPPPAPDSGDQLVADVLAAHSAKIAVEPYLAARSHGATHDQVITAARRRIDLIDYARALGAGATESEIHFASSWNATHTISGYARARIAGATHDQVALAGRCGHSLSDYARLLEAGVTHQEAIAPAVVSRPLPYRRARRAGASHAEVAEVWSAKGALYRYTADREAGCDHSTALLHATTPKNGVINDKPPAPSLDIETPFDRNWLPVAIPDPGALSLDDTTARS